MKIANREKLNLIVKEEKSILEEIKTNLVNNQQNTIENFDRIKIALENMENSKKQLIAIEKIKKAITDLLNKIINAESIDELKELRKNLNNEIRKVRSVLSKVEGFDMEKTENCIKETRNMISELYRNQKRKDRIDSIEEMINNEGVLAPEDIKKIAIKLKNEKAYIRRYHQSNMKNVNQVGVGTGDLTTTPMINPPEVSTGGLTIIPVVEQEQKKHIRSTFLDPYQIEYGEEFRENVKNECKRYSVIEPIMYGRNPIKNIVSFFKNISIYRKNKSSFYEASRDYYLYSSFRGLEMTRDYLHDSTSIDTVLYRLIFRKNLDHSKHRHGKRFNDNVQYIRSLLKFNDFAHEKLDCESKCQLVKNL